MTLARFESMSDVHAFRRILHERSNIYHWIAMEKKRAFTFASSNCQEPLESDITNLFRWTIGNQNVSAKLFNDSAYAIQNCHEMCLALTLIYANRFRLDDVFCNYEYSVICRNNSLGKCNFDLCCSACGKTKYCIVCCVVGPKSWFQNCMLHVRVVESCSSL